MAKGLTGNFFYFMGIAI